MGGGGAPLEMLYGQNRGRGVHNFKNLLLGLVLMGCFPAVFKEGQRPIKASGETAHSGRKTAHLSGETNKRPIKANGLFSGALP